MESVITEGVPADAGRRSSVLVDVSLLGLAVAGFLLLRLPLYTMPGVQLGWNSDSAIFGLIARQMLAEGTVIWFYWGQDYLGTLTSMAAAVAGLLLADGVGPLALRIAVAAELIVGLLFFWDALRRIWGRAAAHLTVWWLIAGPSYFFKLSYAPNAEQMFFVGAIIFWVVVRLRFRHAWHWTLLGLLTGIAWWAHRGAALLVPAAVATVCVFEPDWRRIARATTAVVAFAAGAGIGVLPIALGYARVDQPLYAPQLPAVTPAHVMARLAETVRYDLAAFVGADGGAGSALAALLLVAGVAIGLARFRPGRGEVFVAGSIASCFAFWIVSPIAYSGATRYLVLALPLVFGLAAQGMLLAWRSGGRGRRMGVIAAAAFVAISFQTGRWREMRAIAAGRGERHEHWPGAFDPRPTVTALRENGCDVAYADFWLAYKLEWLSGVPFIPYRSVDRTQTRSMRLASLPLRQCFVRIDGAVVLLNEREKATFRNETLAHWNRRSGSPGLDAVR